MSENTTETSNGTVNTATGELVRNPGAPLAVDQLAELRSTEDVANLFAGLGTELEDIAEYGSGFEVLDDKSVLVGKPFLIVEWNWNWSDTYEQEFASMYVLTEDGGKYIVNDGSVKAGIAAQLRQVQDARRKRGNVENSQRGLAVSGGLSRSDYPKRGKEGDADYRPAGTTYFLAASAKRPRR